jgi:hypothetical protein
MNSEISEWVAKIAQEFEVRRIGFPYASERALHGAALDTIAYIEAAASAQGNEQVAQRLKKARTHLLEIGGYPKITESIRKMSVSLTEDDHREEMFASRFEFLVELSGKPSSFGSQLEQTMEKHLPPWAFEKARQILMTTAR